MRLGPRACLKTEEKKAVSIFKQALLLQLIDDRLPVHCQDRPVAGVQGLHGLAHPADNLLIAVLKGKGRGNVKEHIGMGHPPDHPEIVDARLGVQGLDPGRDLPPQGGGPLVLCGHRVQVDYQVDVLPLQ